MQDLHSWLEAMAERPLPGGVAAAAVAAAMGAALVAKTAQITLARIPLSPDFQAELRAVILLAQDLRVEFVRLAAADEQAYRAVLEAHHLTSPAAAWQQAWQAATEVPLCVAETCRHLMDSLSLLQDTCWPAVHTDLEVGGRLLELGLEAGLHATRANLDAWGGEAASQPLRARLDDLVAQSHG
jgi:formiminotetrahydrofolate cyclodeaminase